MGLTFANYLYVIFVGSVKPQTGKSAWRQELFNEWVVQILCFHLICFTNFIPLEEAMLKYQIGESFKYFTFLLMVVNFIIMGVSLIPPVK